MAKLKCGLIQMGLKGDGSMSPEDIRDRMIEAHIPFIESAAKQKVQVLCFQEVFTQPYFCPSQDRKWYAGYWGNGWYILPNPMYGSWTSIR